MEKQAQSSWRIWPIVFCHGLAALLVASWLFDPTRAGWDWIDELAATELNRSLHLGQPWQLFWALTNVRLFDTVAATLMIGLLAHYLYTRPPWEQLARRLAEAAFIGLYMLIVLAVTRGYILNNIERDSPSLVIEPFLYLSEATGFDAKDASANSYPGDHATVVAMFTAMFWFFAGWRYGLAALVMAVAFTLPRLVSGAHWLTDAIVGGCVIALVSVPWALATPLHAKAVDAMAFAFDQFGKRVERVIKHMIENS